MQREDMEILLEISAPAKDVESLQIWLEDAVIASDRVVRIDETRFLIVLHAEKVRTFAKTLLNWLQNHREARILLNLKSSGQRIPISSDLDPLSLSLTLSAKYSAGQKGIGEGKHEWHERASAGHGGGSGRGGVPTLPVTIYLSDERNHRQVEKALEKVLASAGLAIISRDEPEIGSWFRSMKVAKPRLVTGQEADITAKMMENLAPLLSALQPTKDAVIRVGALLIVKIDGAVTVHQLTPAQQFELDHRPTLATAPHEILAALALVEPNSTQTPAAAEWRIDSSPPHPS